MSDKLRARFEAYVISRFPALGAELLKRGDPLTERYWQTWQTGYKAALEDAAKVCEDKRDDRWRRESPYEEGQCDSANECVEAIRHLGGE